ncbi:ubiquitin-like domain-containing protein [Streptomyces sp. NPDC000594]|uniref:ubiquitin-like domain-containing protein n=1 Tax=Streptomyces sp. NPDC000594 TaxID=3154261 RepID=UPI003331BBB9
MTDLSLLGSRGRGGYRTEAGQPAQPPPPRRYGEYGEYGEHRAYREPREPRAYDEDLVLGTFRPLREPEPRPRRRAAHRAPGSHRRAPAEGTALRRLIPQALVIAFLAGGTAAFVAGDRAVRLTVDGRTRTLHTFADDIGELLAAEGIGTGPRDRVTPAPDTALTSGDEVVVHYGRPLDLTLDGRRGRMWTTARTVGEALGRIGVPVDTARLSRPRTQPIPRDGLALEVRTERSVTVRADGSHRALRTHALTVREALLDAGIALAGLDTTTVPLDSFPRHGQTIVVLRITGTRELREEPVPYDVIRIPDPGLYQGTEIVDRQGGPGLRRVTYEVRTVDGVPRAPRRIAEIVLRPPVVHRVLVGTRPPPRSVPGADRLNWHALAQCESGGRPGAVDSTGTHGGLYQFDTGTWRSLGGAGRPQDASAGEQTYRAKKLYLRRGAAPWPHCGRTLFR